MNKRKFVTERFVNENTKDFPIHHNTNNKIGLRFGKLLVLGFAGYSEGKHKETQYYCKCNCGNYLIKRTGNLNNKNNRSCGCSINELKRLELETMLTRAKNCSYEVIESKLLYRSKWKFKCLKHGEFLANYCDIVEKRTGCPLCGNYGFKQRLPGYFYINLVLDKNKPLCLKFGITNITPDNRLKQLQSSTNLQLINLAYLYFNDGTNALELERLIKHNFKTKVISKELLPSGYTETLHLETISIILILLNLIIKEI